MCACWFKSSKVGIKFCAITAGIKKYESVVNKKKKKHDEMVLLGKAKLNTIVTLIYNALINSHISHDDFVSVNNVLRENNEMKEEIKNFCVIYYINIVDISRKI